MKKVVIIKIRKFLIGFFIIFIIFILIALVRELIIYNIGKLDITNPMNKQEV